MTTLDKDPVLRPDTAPRAGWAEQFARMAENGDDALLDAEILPSDWEDEEWEW